MSSMNTDLVELITERVPTDDLADYVGFRAVCLNWRCCTVDPRPVRSPLPPSPVDDVPRGARAAASWPRQAQVSPPTALQVDTLLHAARRGAAATSTTCPPISAGSVRPSLSPPVTGDHRRPCSAGAHHLLLRPCQHRWPELEGDGRHDGQISSVPCQPLHAWCTTAGARVQALCALTRRAARRQRRTLAGAANDRQLRRLPFAPRGYPAR
jgi:hypothetical protein